MVLRLGRGTPQNRRMQPRHALLLLVGVVAVSFSAIFIRLAEAPALTIAFYRTGIAAALLLPFAATRRRAELRALSRKKLGIALLAGAMLALHFAVWITSVEYTTIAASVVLVTTQPIFVAGFSWMLFGDRIRRLVLAGILLALLGAAVISGGDLVSPSRPRAVEGDLLALAGAITAAAYFVAGRHLRREVSLPVYAGLAYATCAVILLPMALLSGAELTGFPAETWGLFLLMALVPQMLGHTVFNYLLRHVDATVVAVTVMGEPVGATLLGLAIFGESPPGSALLGGALILVGIYVAITRQARGRGVPSEEVAVPME
jgi:drug/metabolite transporter (DMT)-like permease